MEESDLAYLPLSQIEGRMLLERVSMLKVNLAILGMRLAGSKC